MRCSCTSPPESIDLYQLWKFSCTLQKTINKRVFWTDIPAAQTDRNCSVHQTYPSSDMPVHMISPCISQVVLFKFFMSLLRVTFFTDSGLLFSIVSDRGTENWKSWGVTLGRSGIHLTNTKPDGKSQVIVFYLGLLPRYWMVLEISSMKFAVTRAFWRRLHHRRQFDAFCRHFADDNVDSHIGVGRHEW